MRAPTFLERQMVSPDLPSDAELSHGILSALASGEKTAVELHDHLIRKERLEVTQSDVLSCAAGLVEEGLVEGVFKRRGSSRQTQVFSLTLAGGKSLRNGVT